MRTPARVLGLATAFVVMFFAGTATALADAPADSYWSEGTDRSGLWALVVFGGGTAGLFVLIWLFGLLTARTNYVPPAPGDEIHLRADSAPATHHH